MKIVLKYSVCFLVHIEFLSHVYAKTANVIQNSWGRNSLKNS